jgi:N-acetylglucosaminyldiphosphoundecaprenol N-acetyl-beta-D-mannosaminyltransferase
MAALHVLPNQPLMTVSISLGSFRSHVDAIAKLAAGRVSSYVCCVNAHMTVEARKPDFARVVHEADLATADGMPVRYALNFFRSGRQERVAGNDLMPAVLERAAHDGLSVYIYGGAAATQQAILERIRAELPTLKVAGAHAPPFSELANMDLMAEAQRIESSGAHLVLVSLGCPKQERWMSLMKGHVNAVMIGLGGAFLLYARMESRAPAWMRSLALEWLYRLCLEPGRLWKRYLVTNSIFIAMCVREAVGMLVPAIRRKPIGVA